MLIATLALLTMSGQAGDPEVGAAPYNEEVYCRDDNGFIRPNVYGAVIAKVDGVWWLRRETPSIAERNLVDAFVEDDTALELVDGSGAVQPFAMTVDSAVLKLEVPPGTLDGASFLLRRVGTFDGLVLMVSGETQPTRLEVTGVSINAEAASECDAYCVPDDASWPRALFISIGYAGGPGIINVRVLNSLSEASIIDGYRFVDNTYLNEHDGRTARFQITRFMATPDETLDIEVTLTSTDGVSLYDETFEVLSPGYLSGDFNPDDCDDEYYDDYYDNGLGCGCSAQSGSLKESSATLMLVFILGMTGILGTARRRRARSA